MQRGVKTLFSLLIIFLFSLTACTCKIEKDAQKLACLHLQRTETILQFLKTTDASEKDQYQKNLLLLEHEFKILKTKYENKYTDPLNRAKFEEAYSQALKNLN